MDPKAVERFEQATVAEVEARRRHEEHLAAVDAVQTQRLRALLEGSINQLPADIMQRAAPEKAARIAKTAAWLAGTSWAAELAAKTTLPEPVKAPSNEELREQLKAAVRKALADYEAETGLPWGITKRYTLSELIAEEKFKPVGRALAAMHNQFVHGHYAARFEPDMSVDD